MKASQKEVVQALMTYVGKEEKDVKGKIRNFLIYECPKPTCAVRKIMFQAGSGFQNPYRHLKACYGRGLPAGEQEGVLQGMYAEAQKATESAGGTISAHFKSDTLSDYECAINSYVHWIILENCPFTIISSPVYRRFNQFQSEVSAATVQDTIIKLVELVEKRIEREMKDTKGALLFDGWSKRGVHYVAIMASYMQGVPVKKRDVVATEYIPRISLIALSPMAKIPKICKKKDDQSTNDCAESPHPDTAKDACGENDDVEENEAETFNAATHIKFMEDNLSYFGCKFEEWVVCLISDNCSTNRKISSDTSKPLVGCMSHKLNLQVNSMFKSSAELQKQFATVHETMCAAKALKNASILRNLTDLRPVTPNETRWTGKSFTFTRYVQIRDDLTTASANENATIPIDRSTQFDAKVTKSAAMLGELQKVTKTLQLQGRTLADCRGDIEDLQLGIQKATRKPAWKLHNCKLGNEYIRRNSHLTTDPDFESGIVKLQKGEANQLTSAEKVAVCMLEKDVEDVVPDSDSDREMLMDERLNKRRKIDKNCQYRSADFVLGSSAEVERIWSTAKYILSDTRSKLKLLMFEAIMFLKNNSRLWGDQLVAEAIRCAKSERSKKRLDELSTQVEFEVDISDGEDNY